MPEVQSSCINLVCTLCLSYETHCKLWLQQGITWILGKYIKGAKTGRWKLTLRNLIFWRGGKVGDDADGNLRWGNYEIGKAKEEIDLRAIILNNLPENHLNNFTGEISKLLNTWKWR